MPKITPAEIPTYLDVLAQTPHRLAACTARLSDAQLHAAPGPKAWSPAEVLAHLRGCADLWMHSIYAMLAEDKPQLALLDERRWAKAARYAELKFSPALQAFTLQRAELLAVLRGLPLERWSRAAVIAGRTHTVYSQARRMAKHEAEHCDQLETLTGRSRAPSV